MTKFLVDIIPEFEETPEELVEILTEALRDNGLYGEVSYVQE